jgi:hypothetical protein
MKNSKCILLLPTTYNDGKEVPPEILSGLLMEIDEAFDGHTVDGLCNGVYKMDDGSMARDSSLKVWVIVDPECVDELRKLAAKFAAVLKQECIYFEVTEAKVEFVRPPPESRETL